MSERSGGAGLPEATGAKARGAADADPAVGLRAVRALGELADRLEVLQVGRARALGWSWQQIAEALGVSRQAVHQKHRSTPVRPLARATEPTGTPEDRPTRNRED